MTGSPSFVPKLVVRGRGISPAVLAVIVAWSALAKAQSFQSLNLQSQHLSIFGASSANSSAKSKKDKGRPPAKSDVVKPAVEIPVGPLGFAAPAPFYLGDRFSQVSLGFLDDNNLLFTFRVPGLIVREPAVPGEEQHVERHIRAMSLSLPDGKVTAESLWVMHDYGRYLWMLKNGRFLLRDRDSLQTGDAGLRLTPYLRFPGPISFIEFDPKQDWLVADTTEPDLPGQDEVSRNEPSGIVGQPPSASASMSVTGGPKTDGRTGTRNLLRILNMNTGKVMLFSQVNGTVHLAVDGEGYYEALRGNGSSWMISYEYFRGPSRPLGWVDSTCNPPLDALAPGIVLASACTSYGERHLTVFDRDREKDHASLWELTLTPTKVWPQLESSADGLRLARATLEVSHAVGLYSPIDADDIRGQSVQVLDLANGKIELTVPLSPVLDGGGNFALSPSGNRLAVLNAGAIQVYDLPPAPKIPPASSGKPVLERR